MRAVSLRRRRVNVARRAREWDLFEAAPWCARCCRTDVPVSGHERRARSQGGDPRFPDCLLCDACNVWCEDNPEMAAWSGWKLSRKHPHDPRLQDDEAENTNGDIVVFGEVCEVKR